MRLLILLLLKMLKELKFRLVGKQGRRREDGGEGKREREREAFRTSRFSRESRSLEKGSA